MSKTVIIAAGGCGKRLGNDKPKQFLHLAGKPMLYYSVHAFEQNENVDSIIIAVPQEYLEYTEREIVSEFDFQKVLAVIAGGEERYHSVYAGLNELSSSCEIVIVHDGARPFVTSNLINEIIDAAVEFGAAIPGVLPKDTIKQIYKRKVLCTLNRDTMISVQTPQAFQYSVIMNAYRMAFLQNKFASDDAGLVELTGDPVWVLDGDDKNIKITTSHDFTYAEWLLSEGR